MKLSEVTVYGNKLTGRGLLKKELRVKAISASEDRLDGVQGGTKFTVNGVQVEPLEWETPHEPNFGTNLIIMDMFGMVLDAQSFATRETSSTNGEKIKRFKEWIT